MKFSKFLERSAAVVDFSRDIQTRLAMLFFSTTEKTAFDSFVSPKGGPSF